MHPRDSCEERGPASGKAEGERGSQGPQAGSVFASTARVACGGHHVAGTPAEQLRRQKYISSRYWRLADRCQGAGRSAGLSPRLADGCLLPTSSHGTPSVPVRCRHTGLRPTLVTAFYLSHCDPEIGVNVTSLLGNGWQGAARKAVW